MEKEAALPKNVRQIGDIQGSRRIYMEDYVMTYIHRKEQQEEKGFLGVFLGEQQETEEGTLVFIRGLVEAPEDGAADQSVRIPEKQKAARAPREEPEKEQGKPTEEPEESAGTGEDPWSDDARETPAKKRTVLEVCREFFGPAEIQGCCVIGEYPVERMERLAEEIPRSRRFLYHLQEQEENLYWTEAEKYEQISGYFVFYEINKEMQEYMSEMMEEGDSERDNVPDKAIKNFREKIRKKDQIRLNGMLKLAGSFFAVAVLAVGAAAVSRMEARKTDSFMVTVPENEAQDQAAQTWNSAAGAGLGTEAAGAAVSAAGAVQTDAAAYGGAETLTERTQDSGTGINSAAAGSGTGTAGGTEDSGVKETSAAAGFGAGTTDETADPGAEEVSAMTDSGTGTSGGPVDSVEGTAGTAVGSASEGSQAAGSGDDAAAVSGTNTVTLIQDGIGGSGTLSAPGEEDKGNALSGQRKAGETAGGSSAENSMEAEAAAAAGLGISSRLSEEGTVPSGKAEDTPDGRTGTGAAASGGAENISDSRTGTGTAGETGAAVEAAARQMRSSYVIREGDTLADICQTYYGDLGKLALICEANGIEDADMIVPGQKIVLP